MSPETASTISAVAAAVSTTLTLGAVVVAVISLRAQRKDSRDRSRPVIVAELERELLAHGTLNLVLKNYGASVAHDVTVTFDPGPPADIDSLPHEDMWKWLYQTYSSPIHTWAPGWSLSNVVRSSQDDIEPFAVLLNYSGPDGTKYADRIEIDPGPVLKHTAANPSKSKDPIVLAQQEVDAIRALVKTVRR